MRKTLGRGPESSAQERYPNKSLSGSLAGRGQPRFISKAVKVKKSLAGEKSVLLGDKLKGQL